MKEDTLHAMRHSLAHIMASAVNKLWPEAKFGVGPVVDNGFYYDIDLGKAQISEADFPKIEKQMRTIIARGEAFKKSDMPIDEAISWAKDSKQPYKEGLLNDLKRAGTTAVKDLNVEELGIASGGKSAVEAVSFYKNGDFIDLCRGPHVASTKDVGAFKLARVAGTHWRGKEGNARMQRLYGLAFATQEELDEYLRMAEEAKERDHRKLGKDLDLFTFSDLVGSGLPLFTPRGTVLRELLGQYSQDLRSKYGFEKVWTPHMTKRELYEKSGHWDKFGDELFLVKSQETSDKLVLKPMNCPHHTQIYASRQRSYRDLPIRFMENTTDYRDEKTGELHGLSRVRSLTQDDSHVFCTSSQIEEEAGNLVGAAKEMYETFDMNLRIELSFRDETDAYLGDKKLWESAQNQIEKISKKHNLEYKVVTGEAAFYGPKIDFKAQDALGRDWQVATVQLDFVQPSRFGLTYTEADGSEGTPVMIHCALLGTVERFLSVYIEHTAGWFPFWLAPEQVRVLTINDTVVDYANKVADIIEDTVLMRPVKYNQLRYSIDDRNESLGKKIRDAANLRVPLQVIVGPKDKEAGVVSVRTKSGEDKVKLNDFAQYLQKL